jgi:hypothetical protein
MGREQIKRIAVIAGLAVGFGAVTSCSFPLRTELSAGGAEKAPFGEGATATTAKGAKDERRMPSGYPLPSGQGW